MFSPDGRLSVSEVRHSQDYLLIIQVSLSPLLGLPSNHSGQPDEKSDHVMLSVMILFNCKRKKNILLKIWFFVINCINSFSYYILQTWYWLNHKTPRVQCKWYMNTAYETKIFFLCVTMAYLSPKNCEKTSELMQISHNDEPQIKKIVIDAIKMSMMNLFFAFFLH